MQQLSVQKVFKNGLLSVVLQAFPVLLGLVFIPLNIKLIGDRLWGLYSLSVAVLFLFLYFNIGINPSINKKLSSIISRNNKYLEHELLSNGFYFNLFSTFILSILMFLIAPVFATITTKNSSLTYETIQLFQSAIIAGGLSLLISFFRNVYEAKQKFFLVSSLRSIISSVMIVAPTLGFWLGLDIIASFHIVLFMYVVVFCIYFIIYLKEYPFPEFKLLKRSIFKELILFGIWVTGLSLIHPIFLYLDRFFISYSIGLELVSFYTTPYDLVSKMTLVSGSLTTAFFSGVSYWHAKKDIKSLQESFRKTFSFVFYSLSVVALLLALIAPDFLRFWINEEYMLASTSVFRILVLSYFFLSLYMVLLRFAYGLGLPKFPFLLSVFQLPPYVLLLVLLTKSYGLEGAACSLLIKSVADVFFMLLLIHNKFQYVFSRKNKIMYIIVLITLFSITSYLLQ